MSDQTKGLMITLLGVLFVVPDSLFIRLIDAPALVISFWRAVIAGSLVCAFVLMRSGTEPFRAAVATGRYGAIYVVAMGLSGVLFTLAVSMTSVANVVFIIASMPVFAAIFSLVFLGEPISKRMIITMAAVFVGLGVITYGSGETHGASLGGDAVALLLSAVFAVALTAARRGRGVSFVPLVPVGYLLSALVIWPFISPMAAVEGQLHLFILHGAFIAVSSIGLALGPRYITSAEVALLILLESVLAPLLVWYALGEDPGVFAIIGGAVVIGALALSNLWVLARRQRSAV